MMEVVGQHLVVSLMVVLALVQHGGEGTQTFFFYIYIRERENTGNHTPTRTYILFFSR